MLEPGATVDEFTLLDQEGREVHWKDLRGRPVVVFFYPKADTPGCTREACDFRDLAAAFDAVGASVLGVSADKVAKQARFREKHGLTMPLLADPDHVVLEPWGVWGEKRNYGRTYMGIHRTTILFDAEGRVVRVWRNVKVKGHAEAVLEAVREHAR